MTLISLVAGCGFRISGSADPGAMDADPDTGEAIDADLDGNPMDAMIDAPVLASDCPPTYVAIGTLVSRYRLISTAADAEAQFTACNGGGTHLAVVDTQTEANALRQFIDGITNLPSSFVYIGSVQDPTAMTTAGGWISATGAFNDDFWQNGEPNDTAGIENGDEQFAAIWRLHDLLADVSNSKMPALCECDGLAVTEQFKIFFGANATDNQ
jgi:hypothetical protein